MYIRKILVMKNLLKSGILMLTMLSAVISKAQVPVLNSYPSASAVVLLDFDGHTVAGTTWNVNGPFTCNGAGLTSAQITEVFNRVAEDYRPFNINVTTNEAVFAAAPLTRRIRIVITTSHEWYGTAAGGVAYINSFSWGNNSPAFVFSALHGFNIKNISEATAHEAGHTMGLRHQATYDAACVKLSDYNWGQGTGEIGWAPIMGAGYNQNMTLWHSGPSSIGCNNLQTDLTVITNATNGFGYRADDHTNTIATATNSVFDASNQFLINGVVERTDDKDLFKFTMPVFGRFQLNAIPYNVGTGNAGSDLDLQVEFVDGTYATVGSYNPGNILSSVIDTLINAGTYYLRIDGKGNLYAPEYGSLGSYSLQGSYIDANFLPLRRLELKGKMDGEFHSLSWLIDADEKISKQVLEVSADGRNFIALEQPNSQLRNFSYRPLDNRPLRYRLHITLDNQKEHYSNVITIRTGKIVKPQLIENTISGNILNISSPENYEFQVIDASGRIIKKGNVEKGFSSVSAGPVISGMYIIRFSNGKEQWTEKFIKQ
jgi:hypothetical protein